MKGRNMSKSKHGCLSKVLVLVAVLAILSIIGKMAGPGNKGVQQKSASGPSNHGQAESGPASPGEGAPPAPKPSIDSIKVAYTTGTSDAYKMSFLLTFTNTSDQAFKGTISVHAVDIEGDYVGWGDIWDFHDKPLPPDGGQTGGILWCKNPDRIHGIKWTASGDFQPVPGRPTGFPYKELGTFGPTRVVFTPTRDRTVIDKISDGYSKRYASGFVDLWFFDNEDYAKKYLSVRLAASKGDARASALMGSATPNEVDLWMQSCFSVCDIENGAWQIKMFQEKTTHSSVSSSTKSAPQTKPVQRIEPVPRTPEEIARGLLELARSYSASGLNPKAKTILENIVKDYPKTAAAVEAEAELKKLK